MSAYRRILAVVDLSGDSAAVAGRAAALARDWGSELRLLHVVEFLPIEPMGDTLVPVVQIDEQMQSRAQQQLVELGATLGLAPAACVCTTGAAKNEILRYARSYQCDLLVLGSHERHGVSILVNLTEDTLLHAAPCDLLAVRVR
ncbi:MAG TPA: universal stress protein [Steroidobacteraceae bacterium]|nr:universal stress protein [Steroidobacteraceae bacterium]